MNLEIVSFQYAPTFSWRMWVAACMRKARGRHFEHLQLTGSVQSHPHSPGEDTCLWRTEKNFWVHVSLGSAETLVN